ncbi:HlyD family secretion protein [Hoeflea marina]|uniref:HlyD family secretion protein n=1 Tax=Hoeflea marina TaxID=274592 RepID=A0A317PL60_9HYPH|nr:HlyD family efflux transporter periplasmic adaptor subunit [Hoeflea marina]PWW01672.1 HlyD family secretion protein [Hoeflea marina]
MTGFVCAIPLIASIFGGCAAPAAFAVGYVEGEYVLVAPIEIAEISAISAARGDRVAAGEVLVQLERSDTEIAVAQATASLAQAESQLADLRQGKRPQEIAVLEATLNSARAQAVDADLTYSRQNDLLKRGIAAQSAFDDASTARDVARANVAQAEANLAVARLPARVDQIAAAEAAVAQARAVLENARWRLSKRSLSIPQAGVVFDIIRNTGEVAGPQAPVLSVLPDGAVKLRLYVPESALSAVAVGSRLTVHCDGCGTGMTASVTYVATDPEFTPPVIYSLDSRQKLVYLVEARPDPGANALKPGQIVDVDLDLAAAGR